jgi:hypothetical protein
MDQTQVSFNFIKLVRCAVLLTASLMGYSVSAQQCAYLPPGGPMAFGLFPVGWVDVDSRVGDSPLWMDDGRPVIGAGFSSQGGYRRGAIWVYKPYANSLHGDVQSYILPPIPEIRTLVGDFGGQLATTGPWLAATARLTNDSYTVCIFQATNATGWAFRTNLLGNAAANDDRFGDGHRAIAMNGRWLAVIRYESSGRVHLYRVNDEGIWEERQQLVIPGFQTTAINSSSQVAIHDRTLVVGLSQNGNNSFTGQTHVWRRDDFGTWNYETNLAPASLAAGDRFGASIALGQDRIFASATSSDLIATNAGAIFLFERQGGTWTEVTQIAPTNITSTNGIGSFIAYSSLSSVNGDEFLVDGSGNRLRMFQPTGTGTDWKQVSKGRPGRYFPDWESPAGVIKDYGYAFTTAPIRSISVRGHQALVGYGFVTSLHEHGWHAINSFYFSGDPPCSTRPVHYLPIGAPREGHNYVGDLDGDGFSDFEEVYFGTTTDTSNLLSAGLTVNVTNNQSVKVTWPRINDPNLLVKAEVQWSSNLVSWSTNGLTPVKIGTESDTGRDLMEVTLPNNNPTAYLRLQLTTPPPPEEP